MDGIGWCKLRIPAADIIQQNLSFKKGSEKSLKPRNIRSCVYMALFMETWMRQVSVILSKDAYGSRA